MARKIMFGMRGLLLAACCALAVFTVLPTFANAAEETPWIVTRKADNRVLPKQDTLADIENGLAKPNQPAPEAEKAPAKPEPKAEPATPQTIAPKSVARKLAAVGSGEVGAPEFDADFERMVVALPLGSKLGDTKYMNLDGPRRVAVDLMGAWHYKGKSSYQFSEGAVKTVAVGVHPDFIRVVFHLPDASVPAEITPDITAVPGGVLITLPLLP